MAIDGPVALTRAALRDHVETLDDYADVHTAYGPLSSHHPNNNNQRHLPVHHLHPQSSQVQSQVRSHAHRHHSSSSNHLDANLNANHNANHNTNLNTNHNTNLNTNHNTNLNTNLAAAAAASSVAPLPHKWGALSTTARNPADRAEELRARWDLEWSRGMLELHRLGISDALSMPDLVAMPLGIETNELERAYGERADAALVHPWRPANFARYMQDVASSSHLLRGPTGSNPVTGVAHSEWPDRLDHLERLLPRIRALTSVAWNQAEFDAGQEKWRSARRWDEDTELDFGDNASMTSAQASAWMRFQATCEETHLVDPRGAFEVLRERLAWAKMAPAPRQCQDVPSADAAVAPLLQAHHSSAVISASASALVKGPPPSSKLSHAAAAHASDKTRRIRASPSPPDTPPTQTPPAAGQAVGRQEQQPSKPAVVDALFNGSVSSLGRSVSIPARSDVVDDVFGPHPDDHHIPMPPHVGDNAFLPPLTDGILKTDPRTRSRKVTTIAPAHRVVESFTEVSAYLASASYVASLCGPPLRDMAYGVIIVPAGEESLLLGNWRGEHHQHHHQDADGQYVRNFKHEVLEKSRAIKEEERRRERKANIQAKDDAMARQAEDRAEAKRLDMLKKKALEEQRPTTPTPKDVYVASKSEDLFQPTTSKRIRQADRGERAAARRESQRESVSGDAGPSRRSRADPDMDQGASRGPDAGDPLTPPRSDSRLNDDRAKTPNAATRLSGEPRPSLSLFPRRSTSVRDGGPREPLVNRYGEVVAQSPINMQPRRPSLLQPAADPGGVMRRHSDRGRKDGPAVVVRTDRSPRRRHLARTGTSGSMSIPSYDGGFRGRIKRLKGRMGLD